MSFYKNVFITIRGKQKGFYLTILAIKTYIKLEFYTLIFEALIAILKNFKIYKNKNTFNIYRKKNTFNINCLTETWATANNLINDSNFHLPHFEIISLERQTIKRGGGILIYVHENIRHCCRNDLSVSDGDGEILTIEIINERTKNILVSCCYRPPDGVSENLSMFLQQKVIAKGNKKKKLFSWQL